MLGVAAALALVVGCSGESAKPPEAVSLTVTGAGTQTPSIGAVAELDRASAAGQISGAIASQTYYIRFSNTGRQEIPNGDLRDEGWIQSDETMDSNDASAWSLTDSGRRYFARIKPCSGKDLCAYTNPGLKAGAVTISEVGTGAGTSRTVKFEAQLPLPPTVVHALRFDHPANEAPKVHGTAEFNLYDDGWRVVSVTTKAAGKTPYQRIEGGGKWVRKSAGS